MEHPSNPFEQKYLAIFTHVPLGFVEIKQNGKVIMVNEVGKAILQPILKAYKLSDDNIFPILDCFGPAYSLKIRAFGEPAGSIFYNEITHLTLPGPDGQAEIPYELNATKMFQDSIIIAFEDMTSKYQEEQAMQQANLDKAVAQGKFEIASEVLHDIGNAVVGFGSYLSRISRSLQQDHIANLQNLVSFVKSNAAAISAGIGADKASAMADLLKGVADAQVLSRTEVQQAIAEQQNIISHIQEILTIQRQYVTGYESRDRKPVDLKEVILDCRSMLFATLDKKDISFNFASDNKVPAIKGDRTKLMQVLLNILKNSIEAIDTYLPERRIDINLTAQNELLLLTIADTGNGFDQDQASHLFERGFTTKQTGSGLGLHSCRSIVESHSGSITMDSPGPGKGTTTTIKFIL